MAALRAAGPLLIETDSPYLAPVPYRGKTNKPAYVPLVAQQIAEVKSMASKTSLRAPQRISSGCS